MRDESGAANAQDNECETISWQPLIPKRKQHHSLHGGKKCAGSTCWSPSACDASTPVMRYG
eukprot:5423618-Pleurochrysis_carterae.AAC.8